MRWHRRKSTVPHSFVLLGLRLQRDPLPYRRETAKPDSVLRHEDYVHEIGTGLHLLVVSDDGRQEEVEKSKEDKEDKEDHEEDENVGELALQGFSGSNSLPDPKRTSTLGLFDDSDVFKSFSCSVMISQPSFRARRVS